MVDVEQVLKDKKIKKDSDSANDRFTYEIYSYKGYITSCPSELGIFQYTRAVGGLEKLGSDYYVSQITITFTESYYIAGSGYIVYEDSVNSYPAGFIDHIFFNGIHINTSKEEISGMTVVGCYSLPYTGMTITKSYLYFPLCSGDFEIYHTTINASIKIDLVEKSASATFVNLTTS